MRPGRHPRNCDCHGRIYNPPLRVRWKFVGVDVLIDPTAKRPSADGRLGEPPLQVRCMLYNLLLMLAMMSRMVSFRGFLLSDNAFSIFRTECRTVE